MEFLNLRYNIINGKIITRKFTISATHHCNLSCRSCTHLSPIANKVFVEPGSIQRVLARNRPSLKAADAAECRVGDELRRSDAGRIQRAARRQEHDECEH